MKYLRIYSFDDAVQRNAVNDAEIPVTLLLIWVRMRLLRVVFPYVVEDGTNRPPFASVWR